MMCVCVSVSVPNVWPGPDSIPGLVFVTVCDSIPNFWPGSGFKASLLQVQTFLYLCNNKTILVSWQSFQIMIKHPAEYVTDARS